MNKPISIISTYWKELLICILLILIISVSVLYNKKINSLNETLQNIQTQNQTYIINKPLDDVFNRENNVYPKIDNEINQLNNNIADLNRKLKLLEKNKITKEQVYENFKNKTPSEISIYFTTNGFTNTTTSSNSK